MCLATGDDDGDDEDDDDVAVWRLRGQAVAFVEKVINVRGSHAHTLNNRTARATATR